MTNWSLALSRIHSVDAIRGLCLINIFVNHITLGMAGTMSPSRIFLCDTSDIFVLFAGLSSALIFLRGETFSIQRSFGRLSERALSLYLANLCIIILSVAVLTAGAGIVPPGQPGTLPQDILEARGPGVYLWHLLSLQQSVGYSVVLRLYILLTLVTPLYLWCAARAWWLPIVPALAVWAAAGHYALVVPNSLSGEPLSMTFLPWNLVYAAGICLGAAILRKVPLPRIPALDALAVAVLAGSALAAVVGARLGPDVVHWFETRNDVFWTGGSKTLQSPLRVLSLLALVWLFLSRPGAPLIRLLHAARPGSFLCRLGRRSLQVFAFGAVYALTIDEVLRVLIMHGLAGHASVAALLVEVAGIALGLAVMGWIAAPRRATPHNPALPDAVPA